MPGKRKYTRRGASGMRRYKRKDHYAASKIQAAIRRALNKNIETKQSLQTPADGLEIAHNNFQIISSTPLATNTGVEDVQNSLGQRIGDEINLKGLSLKFMVELNERYSDVTFKLFIVKSAKGDTPTRATMFNGISGNKMIDTFNRERYTKIYSETFKLKAPNNGSFASRYAPSPFGDSGIAYRTDETEQLSRATKIVKVWVPGEKFVPKGLVQYENNSGQVKFYDYHILLYAYSNYSTNQDVWYIARLNDAVIQLYYKDA